MDASLVPFERLKHGHETRDEDEDEDEEEICMRVLISDAPVASAFHLQLTMAELCLLQALFVDNFHERQHFYDVNGSKLGPYVSLAQSRAAASAAAAKATATAVSRGLPPTMTACPTGEGSME